MRTVVYLGVLTGLLIGAGFLFGGTKGAIAAFVIAAVINFVSYWFSDKIVLAIYGAKELAPEESPNIHKLVAEIAKSAGLPKPRIFLIPMAVPNAFATGRNQENAVIGLTLGILDQLGKDELKGVLAHEMSHIKNNDILIGAIAATLAGAVVILARISYYASFLIPSKDRKNHLGTILSQLLFIIMVPVVAALIRMAISRSREYLADSTGVKLCRSSSGLASALRKISAFSQKYPLLGDYSNHITSHLFIVNPFQKDFISGLFSTHPPIDERIKKMMEIKF